MRGNVSYRAIAPGKNINLYAQLVLVAELRPKQCSLRLSADAASATTGYSILDGFQDFALRRCSGLSALWSGLDLPGDAFGCLRPGNHD